MPFEKDQVRVPLMPVFTFTSFKRNVSKQHVMSLQNLECCSSDGAQQDTVTPFPSYSKNVPFPCSDSLPTVEQSSRDSIFKDTIDSFVGRLTTQTKGSNSLSFLTLQDSINVPTDSCIPVLTGFRRLNDQDFEIKTGTPQRTICNPDELRKKWVPSYLVKVFSSPSIGGGNKKLFLQMDHRRSFSTDQYQPNNVEKPEDSKVSSSLDDPMQISLSFKRESSVSEDSTSSGYDSNSSVDSITTWKLSGLNNLGNTCFINAVVQCLHYTDPLRDYLLHGNYEDDVNTSTSGMKGELVKAFSKLLEFMSDVNVDILTKLEDFDCCIRKFTPYFPRNSQQDAQEFMRYLLHGLHEDVNRVKTKLPPITKDIDESLGEYEKSTKAFVRYLRNENSKIIDIFLGQLRSRLKCTVCGYSSVTFDPFWDLSISIPKGSVKVSLQQCLTLFTKEEILDAHEKPVCSRCRQRQRCSKRLTLHRFPNVLVLHLKRFNSTGRDYTKLPNSEIDYPLENLDLRPYSSGNGSKIPVYTLYAVVLHSGSDESGHYTATCRHPATKEWHHFNDLRVSKVLSTQVISPNAYILFYKLSNLCSRL